MKSFRKIGSLFKHKNKAEGGTSKQQTADSAPRQQPEMNTTQTSEAPAVGGQSDKRLVRIYIVYYSMYGHVLQLAQAIKEGIDSVQGCSAEIYQVAETLPEEVLAKLHAPSKANIPLIAAKDLPAADGLVFGFPTRFGMMCSQMKALFDATGSLWSTGALAGKPAALFTSSGTQGGGQETTILTALTQLVHHGMIFVPPGYTHGSSLFDVEEVRGGSPWGAGTFAAADGSRQPSEKELAAAKHQGAYFAAKAKLLVA